MMPVNSGLLPGLAMEQLARWDESEDGSTPTPAVACRVVQDSLKDVIYEY